MIKTLLKQVGEYKTSSLLTPVFTGLEVLMEVLIPFITAAIIDQGIEAGNIQKVYLYGGIMLAAAFFSLAFGALAGRYAAKPLRVWPATCGKACMKTSRRFPSPILINSALPALLQG